MNLESIVSIFCKLSGESPLDRSNFIDIITCAYHYLLNRLIKAESDYTAEEINELEYTAACISFYNYNTVVYSRENRLLSESGKFISENNNLLRLKSSELMMNIAIKSIRHLIDDDDFIFVRV